MDSRRRCCACCCDLYDDEGSYCKDCLGALAFGTSDWELVYRVKRLDKRQRAERERRVQAHIARVEAHARGGSNNNA